MPALPPIPPDIVHITAPLLLGNLWNWFLFGVLVVQTYVYSYNFPEDKRYLKLFVYVVFSLEVVQTVLSGADIFYWFCSGYGDVARLASPFASTFDVAIIECIVSAMVQCFCAYRVWVLSNKQSRWFCLFICLCSTINVVAGFTGGIYTHVGSRFATGDPKLQSIAIIWLSANAASDILIASAMLYYLTKRRKECDGFFQNKSLVKVVRLMVESNLLTTSVGIVALLAIVIFPNENWYTCPMALLGKLYSNTLLVSLNNRISIRNSAAVHVVVSQSLPVAPQSDSSTDITFIDNGQFPVADKFQVKEMA